MNKIMRATFMRLKKGRELIVFIVAVIVFVVITAVSAILFTIAEKGKQDGDHVSFEDYRPYLTERLQKLEDALESGDTGINEEISLKSEVAQLRYYLDTQTVPEDYCSENGAEKGVYAMRFFYLGGVLACAVAVLWCSRACFAGAGKRNATALLFGVGRKQIFTVQNAFSICMALAVWLVFSVAMFVCALFSKEAVFLVTDKIVFRAYAVSVFAVAGVRSFAMFAITVALGGFVNAIAAFTQKTDIALIIPSAVCIVSFAAMLTIYLNAHSAVFENVMEFFPVAGLTGNYIAYTPFTVLSSCLHLAAGIIAYVCGYLRFCRREM